MKKNIYFIILSYIIVFYNTALYSSENTSNTVGKKFEGSKEIVFAGGCFWCIEHDIEQVKGVYEATSGYAGGTAQTANYTDSSSGKSGHREVVKVQYNPNKVTLKELLLEYFMKINPLDEGGQFCDRGNQYSTAIYYKNEKEKEIAKDLITELNSSGLLEGDIKTKIVPLNGFWQAEDYHLNYAHKNKIRYNYYRLSCGRDKVIKIVWKKYIDSMGK